MPAAPYPPKGLPRLWRNPKLKPAERPCPDKPRRPVRPPLYSFDFLPPTAHFVCFVSCYRLFVRTSKKNKSKGKFDFQKAKSITIISSRERIMLHISTLLCIRMAGRKAEIHVSGVKVYKMRMPRSKQQSIICAFDRDGAPTTEEGYLLHSYNFFHNGQS